MASKRDGRPTTTRAAQPAWVVCYVSQAAGSGGRAWILDRVHTKVMAERVRDDHQRRRPSADVRAVPAAGSGLVLCE